LHRSHPPSRRFEFRRTAQRPKLAEISIGFGALLAASLAWGAAARPNPATHSVFFPVGNPEPDFDDRLRPGDNLYTDSVIVLDADTGKLRWYVQQNPHDTHDWDTAAAPTIFEQDGRSFMAVGSKDCRLWPSLKERSGD
jgi:hypothetical protein